MSKSLPKQGQDWPLLTKNQKRRVNSAVVHGLKCPEDQEDGMALVSRALTLCPIPFRPVAARQITSYTRTATGIMAVTMTSLDPQASLPYGKDAFYLDVLASEARKRNCPEITTEHIKDLMRVLGETDLSGTGYRLFMERIARIAALAIRIERGDGLVLNARVVDMADSTWWSKDAIEKEGRGERPLTPYTIRLSPEFFSDLVSNYIPVPIEILATFASSPTDYALCKWLWYRSRFSMADGNYLLHWEDLMKERGSLDGNPRRFKGRIVAMLKVLEAANPNMVKLFKPESKGLRFLAQT